MSRQKISSPSILSQKDGKVPDHKLRDFVAEQLQELRQRTSWKQGEIAQELRRTQGQVSRYETGQRDIPVEDLARIARLLQVPVQEFFPADLWDKLSTEEVQMIQLLRKRDYPALLRAIAETMS